MGDLVIQVMQNQSYNQAESSTPGASRRGRVKHSNLDFELQSPATNSFKVLRGGASFSRRKVSRDPSTSSLSSLKENAQNPQELFVEDLTDDEPSNSESGKAGADKVAEGEKLPGRPIRKRISWTELTDDAGEGSKPMSAASRIDSAQDGSCHQSPAKVMFIGAHRGPADIPSFAADEPSGRSEGPRLVKQQTRRASVTAFELSRMASRMPTDLDIDSEEDIDDAEEESKASHASKPGIPLLPVILPRMEPMKKLRSVYTYVAKNLPIINPDSWGRRLWDVLIISLVIYNAILVPYEIGFTVEKSKDWKITEILIDAMFILDVLLNFWTAYTDQQGHMITVPSKIASHYLRSWFAIDLIASIPYHLFVMRGKQEDLTFLKILRVPRLLRLGRLMVMFDHMKNTNILRIVQLMMAMILLAHWVTCTWSFLANASTDIPWVFDTLETDGEMYAMGRYQYGYMLSLTLMMGDNVNPVNSNEALFCSAVLIVGACFMAVVVGNMAMLVSNMNSTKVRNMHAKDRVTDAVRYIGMPPDILERVRGYFDYVTRHSHPGQELMDALSSLPPSLHIDILSEMLNRVVKDFGPFKNCEENFIRHLVMHVGCAAYIAGERVFAAGEQSEMIHFIFNGRASIMSDTGRPLWFVEENGCLEENALLGPMEYDNDCMCVTPCDILTIRYDEYQAALEAFPMAAAEVKRWERKKLGSRFLAPGRG